MIDVSDMMRVPGVACGGDCDVLMIGDDGVFTKLCNNLHNDSDMIRVLLTDGQELFFTTDTKVGVWVKNKSGGYVEDYVLARNLVIDQRLVLPKFDDIDVGVVDAMIEMVRDYVSGVKYDEVCRVNEHTHLKEEGVVLRFLDCSVDDVKNLMFNVMLRLRVLGIVGFMNVEDGYLYLPIDEFIKYRAVFGVKYRPGIGIMSRTTGKPKNVKIREVERLNIVSDIYYMQRGAVVNGYYIM